MVLVKDFVMFAATMRACAVLRRLSSRKSSKAEDSECEQPLDGNHGYPQSKSFMDLLLAPPMEAVEKCKT